VSAGEGALRLIADVGGTNARFALAQRDGSCIAAANMRVADYSTFQDALAAYLEHAGVEALKLVENAAFAAAGPVDNGVIKLTNAHWVLSARDVSAQQLGGVPTRVFNDLEAVGHALPFLEHRDVTAIGRVPRPAAEPPGHMVAVNVGTGFGAATAIPAAGEWMTCPSEAGHMTLGPADTEEAALLAALVSGRMATLEDVLSGPGVSALYAAISGSAAIEAGEVFTRAGTAPAARRTVTLLSRWLGRAAGDLVLASAAWGGAYLLGGVVNGWAAHCDAHAFRAAFEDKGKMRERISGVFSGVVTRQDVALLGLAKAAIGGGSK
jgi:glucokinase